MDNQEEVLFEALIRAVGENNCSAVWNYITFGVNVNERDKYGWTPLMRAVLGDHEEIVRLLINGRSDVNFKNDAGWSALKINIRFRGKEEIVRQLIEAGAERK